MSRLSSGNNTPALAHKQSAMEFSFESYITGFVDGDGTFSVSFNERSGLKTGVEVRPSFSISQNKRSFDVLEQIRLYFQCGGIRFSKADQCYKYEVRSVRELVEKIIPHFDCYPLRTSKREDFERFKVICLSMRRNLHLNDAHLRQMIKSAFQMNPSGKRRVDQDRLLKRIAR